MRFLLALFLFCWSSVFAQTAPAPLVPAYPFLDGERATTPFFYIEKTYGGVAAGWWAWTGTGWGLVYGAITKDEALKRWGDVDFAARMSDSLSQFWFASDKKAKADALLNQYGYGSAANTPCWKGQYITAGLPPDLNALCEGWAAYAWARKPAPLVTYRVKANSTYPDRPVRTLVNGVLSTANVPNVRAKVGEACNVTRPTLPSTGTDLWAEFGPAFTATYVAVCAKVQ